MENLYFLIYWRRLKHVEAINVCKYVCAYIDMIIFI